MAHVVLGRVFGALVVQHRQHGLLEGRGIGPLLQHIVEVEDVAEEMPVGEGRRHLVRPFRRHRLDPVAVVAAQRHVQRDKPPGAAAVHRLIAHGRARHGKAVQQRLGALGGRAAEPAVGADRLVQDALGRVGGGFQLQDQVMLVAGAEVAHPARQPSRRKLARDLKDAVAQVRSQGNLPQPRIRPSLQREHHGHPGGAEPLDEEPRVPAEAGRHVPLDLDGQHRQA